ncbi:MAG: hypothetical protein AB1649_27550 [Chloroflexota bacterium]
MKIMKLITVLFVTALAALLTGCGPTMGDVVLEFKPRYDNLRADLQAIAGALPETAADQQVTQVLDPAPDYNADDYGGIRNTDIVMYAHLLDPELDLRDNNQLDLGLSRYVVKYLEWTGTDFFTSDKRASDDWIVGFEQALDIRYLGIARVGAYDPPVAVSADSFTGGYAEVDGFLVDLHTREVLCSFSIAAEPSKTVSYSYEEGEDRVATLQKFAHSTLWENAREAFITRMQENCGGSFLIK